MLDPIYKQTKINREHACRLAQMLKCIGLCHCNTFASAKIMTSVPHNFFVCVHQNSDCGYVDVCRAPCI